MAVLGFLRDRGCPCVQSSTADMNVFLQSLSHLTGRSIMVSPRHNFCLALSNLLGMIETSSFSTFARTGIPIAIGSMVYLADANSCVRKIREITYKHTVVGKS